MAHPLVGNLYEQLKPLACKTTGDGACGLYAIIHAIADLCAQAEENAKKKPGDAGVALRYLRLRDRLAKTILLDYQKTHPGATLDDFINAFINAAPLVREAEFSPYFRELFYRHVAELDADGYKALQADAETAVTKDHYLKHLRNNPGYWFHDGELERILHELGVNAGIHVIVNNEVKKQASCFSGKHPYAGEVGLIHMGAHWEWIAKSKERADAHNMRHSGRLFFGGTVAAPASYGTSTGASSPTPDATSSFFGSGDFTKLPPKFLEILNNFGFTDDSAISKIVGFFVNFFMAMFGIVRTVTKMLNPDLPLDADDLKKPGGATIDRIAKALGKAGEGLNQAFRNAAPGKENAVLADGIKRLIDNKQYDFANQLLKEQEMDLVKTSQKVKNQFIKIYPGQEAKDAAEQLRAGCERVIYELAGDNEFFAEAGDLYKQQNLAERLALLAEGRAIVQDFEELDNKFSNLASQCKEDKASIDKAKEKRRYAEDHEAEWEGHAALHGEDHPNKFDPKPFIAEIEEREKKIRAAMNAFKTTKEEVMQDVGVHARAISQDFLPAHQMYVERERKRQGKNKTAAEPNKPQPQRVSA